MWRLIEADCVEAMRELPEASIDAIVTDPPYGLGFMGKEWDDLPPGLEWAQECIRVLKPGGHLLAFGGSRTYHRLACAVEDAGFEVRDQMMWLYGSGFPKSLNVGKAIDKAAGAEREVVGEPAQRGSPNGVAPFNTADAPVELITAPATPEAEKWEGWGTALKPAHEPIVVARKPLSGTVAANVLEFGTGALNINGCRIEGQPPSVPQPLMRPGVDSGHALGAGTGRNGEMSEASGRWPANVILNEEAGRLLDEQSGESKDGTAVYRNHPDEGRFHDASSYAFRMRRGPDKGYGGSGGASRFFYCPKASKGERNAGLDGFDLKVVNEATPPGTKGAQSPRAGAGRNGAVPNHHPTVKPIELMRYLCRLVTPPGGIVLDPFTGSGTTGCAAVLEGFEFVGVEREAEYAEIAKARIAWWEKHQAQGDTDDIMRAADEREAVEEAGQLGLLDEAA
jgi:site-specific DNA-methyltransferase (adenine-specific)